MDEKEKLKMKIEDTPVKRPERLSQESITSMLIDKKVMPVAARRLSGKKIVSLVAAFAVVLGVGAFMFTHGAELNPKSSAGILQPQNVNEINAPTADALTQQPTTQQPDGDIPSGDAPVFEDSPLVQQDYENIRHHFLSLSKKYKDSDTIAVYNAYAPVTEKFAESVASAAEAAPKDGYGGVKTAQPSDVAAKGTFTGTNVQVADVDEADIIKNDGRYLYILTDGKTVNILDTQTMQCVSSVEITDEDEREYLSAREIYVTGDTLIVCCSAYEKSENDDGYVYGYYGKLNDTVNLLYDITDRAAPKMEKTLRQNGELDSTRLAGNVLYTVSTYRVSVYTEDEQELLDGCIPKVNGSFVPAKSIYWDKTDDDEASCYIILTAADITQPNADIKSVSMLGSSEQVYCSASTLYVCCSSFSQQDGDSTKIHAFRVNGTDVQYQTCADVPGRVLNQYSLDEFGGYLRIATTKYNYSTYIDESSVYVLDGHMKIVGKLEDLAYDESIKSVRFMGNTGYVVTFLNTDPLFVIDLSEPTAPKAVGEVKLPGFSSYLHPVGDGLLCGVGYAGDDESADFNKVKISLFNVKDPQQPFEVNGITVDSADTAVNYDAKAFMAYAEKGYIGIPLKLYKDNKTVSSFMVLKVNENGLEKVNGFMHDADEASYMNSFFRGTCIGDNLYTISDHLVKQHSLTDFTSASQTELKGYERQEPFVGDLKLYNTTDFYAEID